MRSSMSLVVTSRLCVSWVTRSLSSLFSAVRSSSCLGNNKHEQNDCVGDGHRCLRESTDLVTKHTHFV